MLLVVALTLGLFPTPLDAQENLPRYWQYTTAAQLEQIQTADLNQDGVLDFLVADVNGKLDWITAEGEALWSFTAPAPIQTIRALNVDDSPEQEIALGLNNSLLLLNSDGTLRWQTAVLAVTPPPSLLTNGGLRDRDAWLSRYNALPIEIQPYRATPNAPEQILLLLSSGQLQLFDAEGQRLWQYLTSSNPAFNASPQLLVDDLDQNGDDEIVLGVFTPRRFSRLQLMDGNEPRFSIAISRRITAVSALPSTSDQPGILMVGTNFGQLDWYTLAGERTLFRNLADPIFDIQPLQQPNFSGLMVTTQEGEISSYDREGGLLWEQDLELNSRQTLLNLSVSNRPSQPRQPHIAALIANSSETINVRFLDGGTGIVLSDLNNLSAQPQTTLLDINQDGQNELLLARFATLALVGFGTGPSTSSSVWEYALNAPPLSAIIADLNGNGQAEIVIGTEDGRLLSLALEAGIPRFLNPVGGEINQITTFPRPSSQSPYLVVTRNNAQETRNGPPRHWIELRDGNGEREWGEMLPAPATALLVDDTLSSRREQTIIVGTTEGQILAYDRNGMMLWQHTLQEAEPVQMLHLLERRGDIPPELLVVTPQQIYGLHPHPEASSERWIAAFEAEITAVFPHVPQTNLELSPSLIVVTDNGQIHGLNWRGFEMRQLAWPSTLGAPAIVAESFPAVERGSPFLFATRGGELLRLDVVAEQPQFVWQLENVGNITALLWEDSDDNGIPDSAVLGDQNGRIRFLTQLNSNAPTVGRTLLNLGSTIFKLGRIQNEGQQDDLAAIATNGLVRLYTAQQNHPPLLTSPSIEAGQGQSNISINLRDIEGDPVRVTLELQDSSGNWQPQEEKQINSGLGTLSWLITNPSSSIRYRFRYSDGFYEGLMQPPAAAASSLTRTPLLPVPLLVTFALLSGAALVILSLRQTTNPESRARRNYQRLRQQPTHTLRLIETRYISSGGSAAFLPYLANQARQQNDPLIAKLADGLFLLESQPQAGLPIVLNALKTAQEEAVEWLELDRWQLLYEMGESLMLAPSLTELSLLYPQWQEMLTMLEEKEGWSPMFDALSPIFNSLRDSERVDIPQERLYFLNETSDRLRQLERQLPEFSPRIERPLILAIVQRWAGLTIAATAELRGRAEPTVALLTKRVAPHERTGLLISLGNNGRAPAENITVQLEEDPAYIIHSDPHQIPILRPNQQRELRVVVEPTVTDRFRLLLTIQYDDQNQQHKTIQFGDMVNILQPIRNFKPIANPYLPGTPLRRNSPLFYGRQSLFNFIANSAGNAAGRNILILIGQRRTGKTSALLRLSHHLPDNLLPVYIDCQSLGVTPGMPALLYDLAWQIADALALQEIEVDVPDVSLWQDDPTGRFQRHFLGEVRRQLPAETIILLVFDEFESFEALVRDKILPPTFFTYMRHLMQHNSQGLGFIFVGTRRLEEMTTDYWSVLFNIALYQKIGYLDDDAATQLITQPVAPHLIYDDLALNKVLRVSAGHPYFLQLICYTLVKQANERGTGYITISDVNIAIDEMLSLGEVHFAYLWQRSSFEEKATLTAVSNLMDRNAPLHPKEILTFLHPYGVQMQPQQLTAALNSLVERDIMQELHDEMGILYTLKIELVGLWVAKTKSLNKLFASRTPLEEA